MTSKRLSRLTALFLVLCMLFVTYVPVMADEEKAKARLEVQEMLSPYFSEIVDTRNIAALDKTNEEANELSFVMNDGSKTVYVFSEPVKFLDENGELKSKDISIVEQTDPALSNLGYAYANGENDYRINFSTNAAQGLKVTYNNVGYTIAPVLPSGASPEEGRPIQEEKDGEIIDVFSYPGAFGENTTLKYYPQFNGFKDDIVLTEYDGQNQFQFLLNTYGCYARVADDIYVQIVDSATDEVIQTFTPAFAYDAEGNEYSEDEHFTDDCSYVLEELGEHQYRLTIVVSEEFLTSPDTVYPVTVDPTTGNIANSMDTPIHSKRTTSGASGDANCVGDSTALGHSRSLIKFNLPSEIKSGATINSAYFWTRELTARTTTMYVGAHQVNGSWNNNTVWSNQPSFNSKSMDRKNINSKSTDGGPNGYWYKFNITSAVNAWTHGTANNGIILKSESEGSATYYQRNFAQMEYTTSGYRPYTVINYTNDTAAPTITSVTGNPTAWTNGNVTLKVNGASDGSGSGLHAQPYSFSTTKGQYSWQASASKTFTSNQTVYVYTRDKLGNIALRSTVTINKIDKTGPSISKAVVSPTAWSSGNGSVTVTATDSGAGIKDYSFDGGKTWQTSNTKTYAANASGIVVKVRDKANNISTYGTTLSITKIDKTAPTISKVTVSPSSWSSGNGSVTVTATDGQSGIKDYSFDGGKTWQTSNTKSYANNTSNIVVKVRDNANNIATHSSTVSITKIDKTAPVIQSVSGNPDAPVNTDVTLVINASDALSGITGYSFDGGETWQAANTKVFTQNTSGIIVKVKDSAGNITTYGETINITNIDKTGPNTPFIYEYMGLVYLYPGDEQLPDDYETEPDTVSMQYRIGASGEWMDYNDETGIEIQRNQDVTVYARSFDAAGNASQEAVKTFRADYAVYSETNADGQVNSVSYTFPFDRSYRSDKSGWTFAFDSHIENPYSENGQENVITAVLPNGESVTFLCRMYSSTNSIYTTKDGEYNLSFFLNQYWHGYEVYFEDYGTFVYDLDGRLVSIRDKNYGYIDITHEGNKVTIASRDFGKTYTYILNEQGNPVSLTDPMGGVTRYAYDSNGNLQTVTDPSGVVVGEYSYNSNGKMIKSQKADIAYGADGGLVSVTQQNGSKTTYSFNADQNAVESIVTDTAGNSIRYTYDNQLRILSQSSDGSATTYTYDEEGRMASSVTDGQTTTYTYDSWDNLICISYPDGTTQEYLYYDETDYAAGFTKGDLIREKDAEGNYTYYNYDNHNNVAITAKLKPLEGGQAVPESYLPTSDQSLFEVTANTYYNSGLLSSTEDRENNVTVSYTYDTSGNLIQQTTTKPKEETGEAQARSSGEMVTETVTYTYDAMGRVLTSTQDGKTTSYIYDAAGRTLKETADGSVTRSLYDSKGRLVQQITGDQYVAADDGLNATTPVNTYANPNVGHRYTCLLYTSRCV